MPFTDQKCEIWNLWKQMGSEEKSEDRKPQIKSSEGFLPKQPWEKWVGKYALPELYIFKTYWHELEPLGSFLSTWPLSPLTWIEVLIGKIQECSLKKLALMRWKPEKVELALCQGGDRKTENRLHPSSSPVSSPWNCACLLLPAPCLPIRKVS